MGGGRTFVRRPGTGAGAVDARAYCEKPGVVVDVDTVSSGTRSARSSRALSGDLPDGRRRYEAGVLVASQAGARRGTVVGVAAPGRGGWTGVGRSATAAVPRRKKSCALAQTHSRGTRTPILFFSLRLRALAATQSRRGRRGFFRGCFRQRGSSSRAVVVVLWRLLLVAFAGILFLVAGVLVAFLESSSSSRSSSSRNLRLPTAIYGDAREIPLLARLGSAREARERVRQRFASCARYLRNAIW